jgi:hypothetical protein
MARRSTGLLIALACAVHAGWSATAEAQAFACTADTAGQLSVQAGVRCECRWLPEGEITGLPAGYRWDCDLLGGRMNHTIPADLNAYQGDLSGLILTDRRVPRRR